MTAKTRYKPPLFIWAWLDTALKKEWEKFASCPVMPDLVPGHELAQGWAYVVAGYSLIEQSLKAILHVRGREPAKTHSLSVLFADVPGADQSVLGEYYDDFRHTFPGLGSFPLKTIDEFLVNLDGTKNSGGQHVGSFDWRYFLIEEGSGGSMPIVSINVMHEIVYGCVQVVRSAESEDASVASGTYSWRLRWTRARLYDDWLMVRMNSAGWGQEGDRLEKLWGPDYRDRYDYLLFKGGGIKSFFAPLPKPESIDLEIADKRGEIASFDVEKGVQEYWNDRQPAREGHGIEIGPRDVLGDGQQERGDRVVGEESTATERTSRCLMEATSRRRRWNGLR